MTLTMTRPPVALVLLVLVVLPSIVTSWGPSPRAPHTPRPEVSRSKFFVSSWGAAGAALLVPLGGPAMAAPGNPAIAGGAHGAT